MRNRKVIILLSPQVIDFGLLGDTQQNIKVNKMNVLSIDVEDWYSSSIDLFSNDGAKHGQKPHPSVVTNTLRTLDLFSETKNTGTFFFLGTVAEHYPDLVKETIRRGHEVGCHSYAHQLVYNMTKDEFIADVEKAMTFLSKAGASNVKGFRAPYWSITEQSLWALDLLREMGFAYDSSIFPIRRGLYGIPSAQRFPHRRNGLWEFPPATVRVAGVNLPVAGGGYLRILPYALISMSINCTANRQYKTFYFHPYELDAEDVVVQKKMRSIKSLTYYLQQVIGRGSNPDKIRRLMVDNDFTSFENIIPRLEE